MSPVFFRSAPFRLGPWLMGGALACWVMAVFLFYNPRVAALFVAGVLGVAGLALLGLGATLWRAEAAARRRGNPPPAPASPAVREADATWRDESGRRLP